MIMRWRRLSRRMIWRFNSAPTNSFVNSTTIENETNTKKTNASKTSKPSTKNENPSSQLKQESTKNALTPSNHPLKKIEKWKENWSWTMYKTGKSNFWRKKTDSGCMSMAKMTVWRQESSWMMMWGNITDVSFFGVLSKWFWFFRD